MTGRLVAVTRLSGFDYFETLLQDRQPQTGHAYRCPLGSADQLCVHRKKPRMSCYPIQFHLRVPELTIHIYIYICISATSASRRHNTITVQPNRFLRVSEPSFVRKGLACLLPLDAALKYDTLHAWYVPNTRELSTPRCLPCLDGSSITFPFRK